MSDASTFLTHLNQIRTNLFTGTHNLDAVRKALDALEADIKKHFGGAAPAPAPRPIPQAAPSPSIPRPNPGL